MKKILYSVLALATVCGISSCQSKTPEEKAADALKNALELAGDVAESSKGILEMAEDVSEVAEEVAEVVEEVAEDDNAGNPAYNDELDALLEQSEELLKKCDKIGEGVGLLDIQLEQEKITKKLDKISSNDDLSSSQKNKVAKIVATLAKVSSKSATSTVGALFGI